MTHIPISLSHCINMDEFTIEGNCVSQLPDGLLSSLTNLSSITLARNQFASFPLGGPTQFTSVHVRIFKFFVENHTNNVYILKFIYSQ